MSRILVTGGAGFIGSHVVDALEANHEVTIIDNLSSGLLTNIQSLIDWDLHLGDFDNIRRIGSLFFRQNILNLQTCDRVFSITQPDAVIHLAAQPSVQESRKKAPLDAYVNIIGTINLLGLCQRYNVKRFVFASTSAVYSPDASGVYSEGYLTNPRTPYGISKLAAEHYIQISGISYAILRLGNVYGPRQVPLGENQLIPRYLSHIFQGTDFVINGDGKQRRDYIYVKDVANAFLKAVESKETGIFNISSGLAFSVVYILAKINLGLINSGFMPSSKWKHGPAKRGELRSVTLDNVLAKHVFGWKPEVDIRDGLKETIKAWPK